jgi:hypothetical protein
MPERKRHIRAAVVEQCSVGDTDVPIEARDSWQALKQFVAGRSETQPTIGQLQNIYELCLGYQNFITTRYRVVHIQPEPNPEQGVEVSRIITL